MAEPVRLPSEIFVPCDLIVLRPSVLDVDLNRTAIVETRMNRIRNHECGMAKTMHRWTSCRARLPAGPGGLLGAAEGLSFLTAVAGLAVLGFQLADYGYVPEAVPVQGGICSKQLSG